MYRIAICDDDTDSLQVVQSICATILIEASIPYEIMLFSCAGDMKASFMAGTASFHITLLDILLGDDNGVEVARFLRGSGYSGSILFISSSKDFFHEGYSVYPVHYLLKPLEKESLKEALLYDYQKNHLPVTLRVPIRSGMASIALGSISYIETLGRETIFHTEEGDFRAPITLKKVRDSAPVGALLQCHKSYLVPLQKIHDLTRTHITLRNQTKIPVGRAFYLEAMDSFIKYLSDD